MSNIFLDLVIRCTVSCSIPGLVQTCLLETAVFVCSIGRGRDKQVLSLSGMWLVDRVQVECRRLHSRDCLRGRSATASAVGRFTSPDLTQQTQ